MKQEAIITDTFVNNDIMLEKNSVCWLMQEQLLLVIPGVFDMLFKITCHVSMSRETGYVMERLYMDQRLIS